MERILILMQAANWAEATEALTSARENALHRNALSYALVLPEAPTSPEECNMAAFGALQYLVSPEMTFAAMETLWHGERYALLAHPAMRFERDWEKKLLRALNDCPVENAQAVLTGYLPAQDDPIGAVCPVAAERIDPDGTLCFAHGMPLTLAAHPMPGAFLHPDFFFARAGFIRAMAQGSGTAFLRAMVQGWQCCTLNQPVITLTHDLPVPPVRIDPQEDGLAQLKEEYGVDFAAGTLSAAAKRGLKSNSLDMTLAVTPLMRIKSAVQRWRRKRTDPMPLCVTVCPASLDEEGMHWLRHLRLVSLALRAAGDAQRGARPGALQHALYLDGAGLCALSALYRHGAAVEAAVRRENRAGKRQKPPRPVHGRCAGQADKAADERHWGAITGIAGGRDDSGDGRDTLGRHCEGTSGLV